MKTRGQFSKPTPFNYQSHQSLNKFRKISMDQREDQVTPDVFKIKVRGQNSKLVARNSGSSKQEENKQLRKHIKMLEAELKRKILQNPILSKILKTKQNSQLSHVDLYMQFIKIKQAQQQHEHLIEQYKKKEESYQIQIAQLKTNMQEKQQLFIQQIEKATEQFTTIEQQFNKKIQEKQRIFERQSIDRESKIQQNTYLIEQLKNKNNKISLQVSQIKNKLKETKKVEQQKIRKLNDEIKMYKKEIQTLKQSFSEQQKVLQNQIESLQNLIAQKQLQIQELDRFIELQKESNQQKVLQLKQNYEKKIIELSCENEKQMNSIKQKSQIKFEQLRKQFQQKQERLANNLAKQESKLKERQLQLQHHVNQLQQQLHQKQLQYQALTQQFQEFKTAFQIELQETKQFNTVLLQQKQCLTQKLSATQQKHKNLTKQLHHLNYQKNELHSKYQKGNQNTEKDLKHYQEIVEDLERKLYFMGSENQGLKKQLEEKQRQSEKVSEINKINEEAYGEKYKAIGRVEEIRHKLETILSAENMTKTNLGLSNFSSFIHISQAHNYKSHHSSLTDCIENLTAVLDKFVESFNSMCQFVQCLKKQKLQDERQIQSVFNHIIEMIDENEELQENLLNYLNIRKEVTKQHLVMNYNEQYLIEKKKQMCQTVIQNLIQIKVIKQYSSAGNMNTYRGSFKQSNGAKKSGFNSTVNFLSNVSQNSKRIHINNADKSQYRSIQRSYQQSGVLEQESSYNNDSLQGSYKRVLFENKPEVKNREARNSNLLQNAKSYGSRKSLLKLRESSAIRQKYQSRLSTEPVVVQIDDIQEQSTYQIQNQNEDYGNILKNSSNKPIFKTHKKDAIGRSQIKNDTSKYKEQIKDRLLSGKRQIISENSSSGINQALLSKLDIQKKYFR